MLYTNICVYTYTYKHNTNAHNIYIYTEVHDTHILSLRATCVYSPGHISATLMLPLRLWRVQQFQQPQHIAFKLSSGYLT